ncbi:MAG: iron ABC transporter permease [Phycisphaerales bacterium]|nr:iron ABC transporter permease [Phycisphaerales bacterium]
MMRRGPLGILLLMVVAALVCFLRLLIDRPPGGSISLAWPHQDWMQFRLTAMLTGIIVGGSLALAGALLQTMLRNPLASPFILGVSSGAGLGIMVMAWLVYISGSPATSLPGQWWPSALAGAMAALVVVYSLGRRSGGGGRGWLDPVALVLVGVVVSTICAGGMMFFQHLVPTGLRGQFTTWLMGSIPEYVSSWRLIFSAALAIVAFLYAMGQTRRLDLCLLSDDEANSLGVALGPLRIGIFLACGVLTSLSVSLAGPIAFVGLVGPHAARLLLGARHGLLLPGAMLCGIILLVGADVLRQVIDLGGGRMPVGVLLTIGGGVVFLILLRVEMRRS